MATNNVINSGATYPATVAKGDILIASNTNIIGIVAGATTAGLVLTAGGASTVPSFVAPEAIVAINPQSGTTYTFVIGDAGKLVTFSNADPVLVTVPLAATVNFIIGTQILLTQLGVGAVTLEATGGVNLYSAGSLLSFYTKYSTASLIKIASDSWILSGDLA